MKDNLDPFGSASAADLNQLEFSRLRDLGSTAQKILEIFGKSVNAAAPILFPGQTMAGPLGSLFEWLITRTTQSEKFNAEAFAYYVAGDLQRHSRAMDALSGSVREITILLEGARRAKNAASTDKVRRLSQVVVTGIVSPDDHEEKVIEFIRFASELNETDIHVLGVLYSLQNKFNPKFVPVWAQDIRKVMHDRPILDSTGKVMDDQYVRSAYARLQALGLVVQLGGTASDTSPGEQHYALLTLGKEFFLYLQSEGNDA